MVFMIGIYWCAKSPDTDRINIRDVREGVCAGALGSTAILVPEGERWVLVLLMWVKARVRAPAMEVVGERESGVVVERRDVRDWRRASRIRRKGR